LNFAKNGLKFANGGPCFRPTFVPSKMKHMSTGNKIALVTGGSRGLGKNSAISLAKKGIDVILTYHSKKEEALAVVAQIEQTGQKAVAIQLDAGNIKSFEAFYKQVADSLSHTFGATHFDFLVNNAGIGIGSSFEETTEEAFDELMNIHFKGVYFLTQKGLPLINNGGRIINISTGLARFTYPGYSAYASMKGAVETLTKYMAKELGVRGIAANLVAPGAIETDFGGAVLRNNEQVKNYIAGNTALGRTGIPDDIGGVVAFLCTEEAKWINGQRIEVSGGMYL